MNKPLIDDRPKLLDRVRAAQAAMQAAVATAGAFANDLAQSRSRLAQANQALGAAPTPQEVQALLSRLSALEAALDNLPPGSIVNVDQVRGQIATLQQQVDALDGPGPGAGRPPEPGRERPEPAGSARCRGRRGRDDEAVGQPGAEPGERARDRVPDGAERGGRAA